MGADCSADVAGSVAAPDDANPGLVTLTPWEVAVVGAGVSPAPQAGNARAHTSNSVNAAAINQVWLGTGRRRVMSSFGGLITEIPRRWGISCRYYQYPVSIEFVVDSMYQ
jgi:hypothetical protein